MDRSEKDTVQSPHDTIWSIVRQRATRFLETDDTASVFSKNQVLDILRRKTYGIPDEKVERAVQLRTNNMMNRRQFLTFLGFGAAGAAVSVGVGRFMNQKIFDESPQITGYATVEDMSFDTQLHAVDDLGMDPSGNTPVNSAVRNAAQQNALIEIPPGEYHVDPPLIIRNGNVGLVGQGVSRRDVRFTVPSGSTPYTFNFDGGDEYLVKNLSWDQGDNWDRLCGNRLSGGGTLKAVETELLGTEPHPPSVGDTGSTQGNVFIPGNGRNQLIVDDFLKIGPADSRDYPQGRSVIICGNRASVTILNSDIQNTTVGQALYLNNTDGDQIVENNYFENTPHTAIRINGNGVARNNNIVIDPHGEYNNSDNRWNHSGGSDMQPMRGIWIHDAENWGSGKATLENNNIWHRSGALQGCIMVNNNNAGAVMDGGRVRSDPGGTLVSAGAPITIENAHFTGNGTIRGNGTISESCIGPNVKLNMATGSGVDRSGCKEPDIDRGELQDPSGVSRPDGDYRSRASKSANKPC